ncbi:MAG: hypothetical protein WC956_11105 [bacterium]
MADIKDVVADFETLLGLVARIQHTNATVIPPGPGVTAFEPVLRGQHAVEIADGLRRDDLIGERLTRSETSQGTLNQRLVDQLEKMGEKLGDEVLERTQLDGRVDLVDHRVGQVEGQATVLRTDVTVLQRDMSSDRRAMRNHFTWGLVVLALLIGIAVFIAVLLNNSIGKNSGGIAVLDGRANQGDTVDATHTADIATLAIDSTEHETRLNGVDTRLDDARDWVSGNYLPNSTFTVFQTGNSSALDALRADVATAQARPTGASQSRVNELQSQLTQTRETLDGLQRELELERAREEGRAEANAQHADEAPPAQQAGVGYSRHDSE